MYIPYLYARQAELSAIASACTGFGVPQQIVPMLEPVGRPAKLLTALADVKTAGAEVYLILNPHQGVLRSATEVAGWHAAIASQVADTSLIRPAIKEIAGIGATEIASFATTHAGRKVAVVVTAGRVSPADLASALSGHDFLALLMPGVDAVAYVAALGANRAVTVSDNFKPEARNADYSGEDWLGNNHLTYTSAGRPAFADFTVLPMAFTQGGGPVGAAAFHLSYKDHASGDFMIQHFVSDTTDQNVGNSSSKLMEAMAHLDSQVAATPGRFENSSGLAAYQAQYATGKPTNLSKNKQQQIEHHLHLVAKHLGL